MRKQAVSLTLTAENLLWLRAQTRARGRRSLSETVDQLVTNARAGARPVRGSQSMVGRVRIAETDPDLMTADAAVRALFRASAGRRPRPRTPRRG